MASSPSPLPLQHLLAERFRIEEVLGRGGFAITYLAKDEQRGDHCVVKELAPSNASREDGELSVVFPTFSAANRHRIRHQFSLEGVALRSLRISGIPSVRATFQENDTAYCVFEAVMGAITLDKLLKSEGRMAGAAVAELCKSVAKIMSQVHAKGILHRDIKPTNILIDPQGAVHVIDFGSARAWHSDLTQTHTVQFTPGFAAPEQLSERARRGPGTDIYGLAATAWMLLTGDPPPPATERMVGAPLPNLREIRPDISEDLVEMIERGLEVRLSRRPASMEDWIAQIRGEEPEGFHEKLLDLDRRVIAQAKFRPSKRGCPACPGHVEIVRPAKPMTCVVCRAGVIKVLDIPEGKCPQCKAGWLRTHRYTGGLPLFCPACGLGKLKGSKLTSLLGRGSYSCTHCPAQWTVKGQEVTLEGSEQISTWEDWFAASLRSIECEICDSCGAQYDLQKNGALMQIHPKPKKDGYSCLFPDEWARVAAHMEPGRGNAECSSCGADYHLEEGQISLLVAPTDPHGVAGILQGTSLSTEEAQWVAAGKLSGTRGPVCVKCGTEFEENENGLELAYTTCTPLRPYVGVTHSLENWQRLGQRLPIAGNEGELVDELLETTREGYRNAEIPFKQGTADLHWAGPAILMGDQSESKGTVRVEKETMIHARLLHKVALPWTQFKITVSHDTMTLSNETQQWVLQVEPIEWVVRHESGTYRLTLTAKDLLARLREL